MVKERLDKILTEKGYFETKSKAQAAIMAGDVKVNGEIITKAGFQFELKDNSIFEIKSMPYVSRGGFKLEKAIKEFKINLKDIVCFDAGASTGGFTDCMLQNGAKKVYSVDVGYGQLAWKLRTNNRVKVIEKVNIRNCSKNEIYSDGDENASFIAMDLSFISIKKVLPNLLQFVTPDKFDIVSLIKPQFEAGREEVGKNGIIRERETHIKVIKNIIDYSKTINLFVQNLTFSPIKGAKGNIEYLIQLNKNLQNNDINIEDVVEKANLNTFTG